jgi:pimeloyl-ACP methyl ester carboxylesterase
MGAAEGLEVIRFGEPSDHPPLLFVHGSYCDATIWNVFFLPAFARRGYHGAAISLRGHGESVGRERLAAFGIDDFVADIAAGAALFDEPPVLIGHSLGGYLAQKYALETPVRGLVLMSAPSLMGLLSSSMHIALSQFLPQNFQQHTSGLSMELSKLVFGQIGMVDQKVVATALFSSEAKAAEMAHRLRPLQGESPKVAMEALLWDMRRPAHLPPTLVIGGDDDQFVPRSDLTYEVGFWKGDLVLIEDGPHGLMVDPDHWEVTTDKMTAWLEDTFGPAPAAQTRPHHTRPQPSA